MAISVFDQPAQAQFVNTYVPIPFQEILQAGQARQNRYDINRSSFEKMAAEADELRAIPESADEAYIEGTVIPVMKQISDQYATQDYGDPEVVRNISRQIRSNIDRRRVANIQQSYAGYQDYVKDIQELALKGTPMPGALVSDVTDYDTSIEGVFSGRAEAGLDFRKTTKEFFDDVKPINLGIRDIAPGQSGLVHGVSLERLKEHAKNNATVWANTPAGNQKIRELRALGANGSDEEIALEFLLREAPEHVEERISNIFSKTATSDTNKKKGFVTPIGHTLRTQPTQFTDKSFKDVRKQTEDYEKQRNDLEGRIRVAQNNGQLALAQSFQNQIDELDRNNSDALFWKEEVNNRTLNKFSDSIIDNIDSFRSSLNDIIKDKNAKDKWIQAYSSAINKNISTEGFNVTNLAAEVNKEYINIFGIDEDYTKYSRTRGYKQSDLTKKINQNYKKARELNSRIDSNREKEWEAIRAQGIIEQTVAMPIIENSADFKNYPEWRIMVNLIRTVPEDFKIDVVSSGKDVKAKKKSELIELLQNADEINSISASAGDRESPYVYVTAVTEKEGKKGKIEERSEVGYKIRITNPDQYKAVAQTFIRNGDMYNGAKWLDPSIGMDIENSFGSGKIPESISINVLGYPLEYKQIDGGYYLMQNGLPINEIPLTSKEEIKANAYSILLKNSGYIQ